jgi:hypothetical protein
MVFRQYVCSPIQEDVDGDQVARGGCLMKRGRSILSVKRKRSLDGSTCPAIYEASNRLKYNYMYSIAAAKGSREWRVTYAIFDPYVCPPIEEEGDGGMVTISSSHMESSSFIL